MAATDSFNSGNDIALVVLPTGCGKTGVAILAAYAIGAKHVLVVTPSVTITQQIGDAFCNEEKSFLIKTHIIPKGKGDHYFPFAAIINKSAEQIRSTS